MGLLKAIKGANNAWAKVSCKEGIGYLGPENFIDNRAHRLAITIGTNVTVFERKDVESITILCSSSLWIKYRILLKSGKEYIATFMALNSSQKEGQTVSSQLLNFEWWMSGVIYKSETPINKISQPIEPTETIKPSVKEEGKSVVEKTQPTKEIKNNVPVKAQKSIIVEKKAIGVEEAKKANLEGSTEEVAMRNFNEERYRFAVQQFEEKNYDVAYDTFLKIRGYENSVGYIEKIEKIKG